MLYKNPYRDNNKVIRDVQSKSHLRMVGMVIIAMTILMIYSLIGIYS